MRKVSDLYFIPRTEEEAFKVARILRKHFRKYYRATATDYEQYHYKYSYPNPAYRGNKEKINQFFDDADISYKVIAESCRFIDYVPVKKIEAQQRYVCLEVVNFKILGDDDHTQKVPEVDVRWPIVVHDKKEDKYYIWDGNNRVAAAILLGEEAIKCRIIYP